jgi:predicted RNase H-like HicB family nuclease
VARHGHRPLSAWAAPDVVTRPVADPLAAVRDQVPLELAKRRHASEYPAASGRAKYAVRMDLHVVFEPDEQGWVRATIEELPGVITCAPTIDEARELVRDALDEWLAALTSEERASIGPDATRETLTLSVA